MTDRNFQKKKRNEVRRHRKPVMLITAEGKNKTERLYFNSFQEQHGKYSIRFVNTGLYTDPAGMLKSMDAYWKSNDLSTKYGDKAYIVLDMDCNPEKMKLVNELQKSSKHLRFIASNPCIEVWFILHFVYTTHQFRDSKEPKKELAKYISGYEEGMYIADIIRPKLADAKKHIEQLSIHYKRIGIKWGGINCNPMTEVADILKELGVF